MLDRSALTLCPFYCCTSGKRFVISLFIWFSTQHARILFICDIIAYPSQQGFAILVLWWERNKILLRTSLIHAQIDNLDGKSGIGNGFAASKIDTLGWRTIWTCTSTGFNFDIRSYPDETHCRTTLLLNVNASCYYFNLNNLTISLLSSICPNLHIVLFSHQYIFSR